MDLLEVGEHGEGGLVAQRNVDKAVVNEGAHAGHDGGLLATTGGTGGDEGTSVLSSVATAGPDAAGLVPEGLPLGGEVTITGGDTEEDSIELEQVRGLSNGVAGLGRGVHLGENLLGESLGNSVWWGVEG